MKYRGDIDGLRAFAVVAVVLFHARLGPISGGYVGVDVFFVISGFLITQLIATEMTGGRFSITTFYERRIRRLFPALFLVLGAVMAVGFWLLLPAALVDLSKSTVAATLFASNVLFFSEAGYFDAPALAKPLLHTWSLAVEEQFYIAYPVLLLSVIRLFPRRVVAVIAALALLSFVAAAWMATRAPDAAFYLAPLRAWELLLGALLALNSVPSLPNRQTRELAAFGGIALVLFAVLTYSSNTIFPGVAALVPCLGTAMIIHAGTSGSSMVARVLGSRWIVFVGLISYSLYLWHWPIFVYADYYLVRPPTVWESIGLVIFVSLISVLSWRFVERPFRTRRVAAMRASLFRAAAAVMVLFVAAGTVIYSGGGLPKRLPAAARLLADAGDDDHTGCYVDVGETVEFKRLCRLGVVASGGSFLVWGDSHAAALAPGVNSAAMYAGTSGWLAVQSGCPPLLGVNRAGARAEYCLDFNNDVMKLIAEQGISVVILAARWSLNLDPRPQSERQIGVSDILIVDSQSNSPSGKENVAAFTRGLARTLSRLNEVGAKVWLVDEVPYVGFDTPNALARMAISGRSFETIAPTVHDLARQRASLHGVLAEIGSRYDYGLIDPATLLCRPELDQCYIARNGRSLYQDDDHLSKIGAEFIAPVFKDALIAAAADDSLDSTN